MVWDSQHSENTIYHSHFKLKLFRLTWIGYQDWISIKCIVSLVMYNSKPHVVCLQPISYRAIWLRLTWSLLRPRHISDISLKIMNTVDFWLNGHIICRYVEDIYLSSTNTLPAWSHDEMSYPSIGWKGCTLCLWLRLRLSCVTLGPFRDLVGLRLRSHQARCIIVSWKLL